MIIGLWTILVKYVKWNVKYDITKVLSGKLDIYFVYTVVSAKIQYMRTLRSAHVMRIGFIYCVWQDELFTDFGKFYRYFFKLELSIDYFNELY